MQADAIPLYDIHAHLADRRLQDGIEDLWEECRTRNLQGVLAAAARPCEWERIAELSGLSGVYGAMGLHPFFVDEWQDGTAAALEAELSAHEGVRAVGEIGLDFCRGRQDTERQMAILEEQFGIARRLEMPVILHNRKSWSEFLHLWRHSPVKPPTGVCHHFTGSVEIARQALDAGLYLSFCGPLTYPNARRLKAAARYAPLNRILTETDAPDLPPQAYRGGTSLPWHVGEVVREIADIRGISVGKAATEIGENFREVLGLGGTWG